MSSSPDSSESRLRKTVDELKSAYCMYRGTPPTNSHDDDENAVSEHHWQRLAKQLIDFGIHPRRYVRWAYRRFRSDHAIVWVTQIASCKTVQLFQKEGSSAVETERLLIKLQLDTVTHQLKSGRPIREMLEDDLLDLDDTIRYAVARKVGMSDVAARFRRVAELDLANEPLYREMLSGFL